MQPRILVTGATGTVGSEVAAQLRRTGHAVRDATRHPERARAQLGDGIDCVRFDFEEPATFEDAFRGVDRLFLVRPPGLSRGRAVAPAIDAARTAGARHVVFLSVLGAGEAPFLPHRKIEDALRASGMAFTFLRPTDFMQNFSTVMRLGWADRISGAVERVLGRPPTSMRAYAEDSKA